MWFSLFRAFRKSREPKKHRKILLFKIPDAFIRFGSEQLVKPYSVTILTNLKDFFNLFRIVNKISLHKKDSLCKKQI